jgi:hypothetical protein
MAISIENSSPYQNREFLSHLLRHSGFGTKWRKQISACISTSHFSILINDSLRGFFGSSWGVRPRDPLWPLLVVIVVDALS